jgi:hypothetical protein
LPTAAEAKFGILLVAPVTLVGAAALISSPVSEPLLGLFTGAVLVTSLRAARPARKPRAGGLALAPADLPIGRCFVYFGTRWLVRLRTVLWDGRPTDRRPAPAPHAIPPRGDPIDDRPTTT